MRAYKCMDLGPVCMTFAARCCLLSVCLQKTRQFVFGRSKNPSPRVTFLRAPGATPVASLTRREPAAQWPCDPNAHCLGPVLFPKVLREEETSPSFPRLVRVAIVCECSRAELLRSCWDGTHQWTNSVGKCCAGPAAVWWELETGSAPYKRTWSSFLSFQLDSCTSLKSTPSAPVATRSTRHGSTAGPAPRARKSFCIWMGDFHSSIPDCPTTARFLAQGDGTAEINKQSPPLQHVGKKNLHLWLKQLNSGKSWHKDPRADTSDSAEQPLPELEPHLVCLVASD
ncbi:hypothetical protein AV530_004666 [Patagioenas fasciata monilis]|uniref:Uncharacterized protein n=1 Tax=Patagioenas fasciata monilis TaxID=372326 RepID=A0A1V4KHV3_PATFA|nr:hypothetical protein AV530_004666 [Patagioenas fasciata monilis]